jgi:hypothetical protein
MKTWTTSDPTGSGNSSPFVTVTSAGLGLVMLGFGAWALLAPRSFFDVVATFPPYNLHLLHDVGALQIGVGVSLLLAAANQPPAIVGLGGFLAFEGLHVASHVIDRELGGQPVRDITFLVFLTAVGATALVSRARHRAKEA